MTPHDLARIEAHARALRARAAHDFFSSLAERLRAPIRRLRTV